jgi:hypothetical protein
MSEHTSRHRRGGITRMRAMGIAVALMVALNVVAATPAHAGKGAADFITGSITIEHIGNHPDGLPGTAFVEFEAFEAVRRHPARGMLWLTIMNSTGEVGRQMTVRVVDVWVDGTDGAFLGIVTADIRSAEPDGGDDHGVTDTGHEEPGHDTGHEEPGHDTGHEEPGHDTGHEEPGHDTGDGTDHGGPGDHATGRDRTGQLMAVTVSDGGSSGLADAVDWKWFAADTVTLEDVIAMPHLCNKGPKVILAGNLVVHVAPTATTKTTPNRSI